MVLGKIIKKMKEENNMTMLLRNNISEVIRKQDFSLLLEENPATVTLIQRVAKLNSSSDARHIETVLVVPDFGWIHLLAITEAFHKFDAESNSRNFRESNQMAEFQWNDMLLRINQTDTVISVLEMFPTLRQCRYFDITTDAWELAELKIETKPSYDSTENSRFTVYGFGKAWDFGNDKIKAQAHLKHLTGEVAEEEVEETTEPTPIKTYDNFEATNWTNIYFSEKGETPEIEEWEAKYNEIVIEMESEKEAE
jgi:hypothetical protein